jgi:hypothetical protein
MRNRLGQGERAKAGLQTTVSRWEGTVKGRLTPCEVISAKRFTQGRTTTDDSIAGCKSQPLDNADAGSPVNPSPPSVFPVCAGLNTRRQL